MTPGGYSVGPGGSVVVGALVVGALVDDVDASVVTDVSEPGCDTTGAVSSEEPHAATTRTNPIKATAARTRLIGSKASPRTAVNAPELPYHPGLEPADTSLAVVTEV